MGAVSVGAASVSSTEALLYANPLRICSPLATAGKAIPAVASLPASSATVTVAVLADASAVSGVPAMTPLDASMLSPDGRPVAR